MQCEVSWVLQQLSDAHVLVSSKESRSISGLSWDSRTITTNDIYLALPGECVDGHDYVSAALEAGASLIIVMHKLEQSVYDAASSCGATIVCVSDTSQALTELAAAWRKELTAQVIVLTGSCGKTTTKNLMHEVLSCCGSVIATEGNQNNELGVPRTLLRAQRDTKYVVVEIGMRGKGQLTSMCSWVKPSIGVITNVGESHIELLGSRENIACAKSEVFEALNGAHATAYINADDDFAVFVRDHARLDERGVTVVCYDGSGKDPSSYDARMRPSVYASDLEMDETGHVRFMLHIPGDSAECSLALRGRHSVIDACAAAAVGAQQGLSARTIAAALSRVDAMSGRQRVIVNDEGVTIIDDAYNANPESMMASLDLLSAMKVPGRRFAMLGDMGELGSFAHKGHAMIGAQVAAKHIDRLLCFGPLSQTISQTAARSGMNKDAISDVASIDEALDRLKHELHKGDAVLIKASHSMGLERIVEGLVK
jgi:UDP-N-acetylmuramoyl-tripeptide--D-alanyl-D-alanine ligase